jgi:DNA recombination protein RmuC
MESVIVVGALVLGLALGGVAGWVFRSGRANREAADRQAEVARLQGQLEQTATTQQLLETARAQFTEAAKLTAAEALQGNNDQFLKLANENLGKTLESAGREFHQRHQQFQELVKPLSENYSRLNPQIESLVQQSQSLAAETGKLSSALTDVRQVGNWGEVQLRRVVEMANMTAYSDFAEQPTTGSSQDRPDLIVRLPEGRTVVVDAKASVAAALEAQTADDENAADAAWGRHAAALKTQVTNLSRKNYGNAVKGSLDFVVMFVPGDQFLAAALRADENLVTYAMSQKVAIATPATLIAMLWAVNSGWQKWEFAKNADEIRRLGTEMHERLLAFLKNYGTVQQRLTQTVSAFNSSVGSLEGRVLVSARRMAEMRAIDPSEIREFEQIEAVPRQISSISGDDKGIAADD